mgnify:CR=1 FL=1
MEWCIPCTFFIAAEKVKFARKSKSVRPQKASEPTKKPRLQLLISSEILSERAPANMQKTAPACGDGLIDSKQNQIVYFNAFCGAFANSARFSS